MSYTVELQKGDLIAVFDDNGELLSASMWCHTFGCAWDCTSQIDDKWLAELHEKRTQDIIDERSNREIEDL